jgi:outer membrane protein assembly factor BamB
MPVVRAPTLSEASKPVMAASEAIRVRLLGGIFAAALPSVALNQACAQASTGYQVNAAHTGHLATKTKFAPPLRELWTVNLEGRVTYPIVTEKRVFIVAADPNGTGTRVFALSAATGKVVWEQAIADPYALSFITYASGTIYDINGNGDLTALDAATGHLKWGLQLPTTADFVQTPPVIDGKSLYVSAEGDQGSATYQIDTTTRTITWAFHEYGGVGLPAVAGGAVLIGAGCDTYLANALTGAQIWHTNGQCIDGPAGAAASYAGKGILTYYDANEVGGVVNWTNGTLEFEIADSAPAFFRNLALQADGILTAADLTSGNIVWSFSPKDSLYIPPIMVNNVVYALSSRGHLYALSAATGHLLQTLDPGVGKYPAKGISLFPGLGAANGLLVVPSAGFVVAYGQ